MKKDTKSTLKGNPLRYVGQSLDARINELYDDAIPCLWLHNAYSSFKQLGSFYS